MQKTRIEYLTHSWNPLVGCLHTLKECPTADKCWARSMARRFHGKDGFLPRWHPDRLEEPAHLHKPARIGVGFMGDMFGEWADRAAIQVVLEVVRVCSQHTFVFLTKNPQGLLPYVFPPNAWVGVSVCNQEMLKDAVSVLFYVKADFKWLSIEPLLERIDLRPVAKISWIVMGAQTGPGAIKPERAWVEAIRVWSLRTHTPLFIKDNVLKLYPDLTLQREFPHA